MSFAALPRELQLRIILLAVQAPRDGLSQALTLARVSKDSYAIITELLYKHVRVTDVPTLRRIHATLEANPSLGDLIQSLHVGPDSILHARGWPIIFDNLWDVEGRNELLKTTLPKSLLPCWVEAGSAFNIAKQERWTCHHHAVFRAIQAAFSGLDVDSRKIGWSLNVPARRIGVRAWAIRLWKVQAALDLYLMEMRRRDQAPQALQQNNPQGDGASTFSDLPHQCKMLFCGHYPILKLGRSYINPQDAPRYLFLSKKDLWRHLARDGSPTEHFEHLILFARSCRGNLGMGRGEWYRLTEDIRGPHRYWPGVRSDVDDDDGSSASSDEADWTAEEPAAKYSAVGVGKGEELLALAGEVLARTPQATNLSLSGFFHKAFASVAVTDHLVTLTLGPTVRWWCHHLLPLSRGNICIEDSDDDDYALVPRNFCDKIDGGATMSRLVSLRICGMITCRDAKKIASQLPSLREFILENTTEAGPHVMQAITNLQGRLHQGATLVAAEERPERYTEVRLRPESMESHSFPIPDVWLENRHVEGTLYPVKVRASDYVVPDGPQRWENEDGTRSAQYAEAREWWEQGLVGLGLHSKLE